ncbi:MAG: hypothetical protein ABF379_16945 [Akkermansiaceae bacterium]
MSKVRTAIEYLSVEGLITTRKKRKGRGLIYRVENYPNRDTKGYFKFYRNILEKPELFGNSEMLRVWVYFLSQASRVPESDFLEPGQVILFHSDVIEACLVSRKQYLSCRGKLERNSRIVVDQPYDDDSECMIIITNWELYQGNHIYKSKNRVS